MYSLQYHRIMRIISFPQWFRPLGVYLAGVALMAFSVAFFNWARTLLGVLVGSAASRTIHRYALGPIVLRCVALYHIMSYIILHCNILHYIILCRIVMHCIILHCIVSYCVVLYCIVSSCVLLHCIVSCCVLLYCV